MKNRCYLYVQDDITVGNELRQAAFCVYASLCANNEDVRKQVGKLVINLALSYVSSCCLFVAECQWQRKVVKRCN